MPVTRGPNTVTLGPDNYDGNCYWQLVEDLQSDKEEFMRTLTLTYGYSIDHHTFTETISNLKLAIGYGYKDSVSVEVGSPELGESGKADSEMNFSMNFEVGTQITNSVDEKKNISDAKTDNFTVTVPAGGSVILYQLTYSAPGTRFASTAYKTVKRGDPIPSKESVTLPVTTLVDISGAGKVIGVLGNTRPGSDNIQEWNTIRSNIASNVGLPMMDQIDKLIALFQTIFPGSSNTDEWAFIRDQCKNIQATVTHPLARIKAFFYVLNQIRPGRDNTREWAAIRGATYEWAQANGDGQFSPP